MGAKEQPVLKGMNFKWFNVRKMHRLSLEMICLNIESASWLSYVTAHRPLVVSCRHHSSCFPFFILTVLFIGY
jgi:hypothetical protein